MIDFLKGFIIIIGEIGAGKFILLGVLGLVMGWCVDIKFFYNLDFKCIIEGFFNVEVYDLCSFFDEYDLDFDFQVVIWWEIMFFGKFWAFVNDILVMFNVLQDLSFMFIDLYQ